MLFWRPFNNCIICGSTENVVNYPSECRKDAYICKTGHGCKKDSQVKMSVKKDSVNSFNT
ncbi:hypothetical protein [Priestia aryabhattai]